MSVIKSKNINYEDTPAISPHYHKGSIDVIEFLERYFPENKYSVIEGFYIGNIIKYVCRFKEKNGYEDLEKAEDYLNRLMDLEGRK